MNFYVASSIDTRNEIKQLSGVHNWFTKHAYSSPMLGQADDSIIGSFCLTRSHVKFDKYHAMLLHAHCMHLPDFNKFGTIDEKGEYVHSGQKVYTGRDMITMSLIATPVNLDRSTNYYMQALAPYIDYKADEIKVSIKNGVHLSGVLDKKTIAKGNIGGLYHLIAIEYGPQKALEVMYNMQQLAINYLSQRGFTFSIMDLLISPTTLNEIYKITSGILRKSDLITEQLDNGEIIPPVGKTVEEYYEELQIANLKIIDDYAQPVFSSIDATANNFIQLILSGSKGSINHFYHVSSSIGQIVINGKRPQAKFAYARTFPHFPRYEKKPEANGFIANSYISGMNAVEEAANAMNARFDFISKALYTSVTGESNRKSVKNLESIIVNNCRMCVKASNIVQLVYGDNSLDTRYMLKVKIPTIKISNEAFATGYKYTPSDVKLAPIFDAEFKALERDRQQYRDIYMRLEKITPNEPISDERLVCIDVARVLSDVLREHGEQKPSEDEIAEMVGEVALFCDNLHYTLVNSIQAAQKTPQPDFVKQATWPLELVTRAVLCSKNALTKLSKKTLQHILDKIKVTQLSSLVEYGCAIGIIAALSFSEPLTQYMLDAHHRTTTGGTSKSVMSEVREVLGAKPKEKLAAPSMILTLKDPAATHQTYKTIANYIESMKFRDFVSIAQIFFEKFGEPTHPRYKHEAEFIEEFKRSNPAIKPPADLIKWCCRFVINKNQLIYKNMNLELIVNRIRDQFPDLYVVYTPENSEKIILRVYIRSSHFKEHVEQDAIETVRDSLLDLIIRGVSGIISANVTKLVRGKIEADGSIGLINEKLAIKTNGTNLSGILDIAEIDPYETQTDAIEEIQNLLGIEAARQRLITSIRNLGAGGLNYNHVSIYADEITFLGRITSIEKQGLGVRETNNVMLRMGFSSPIQTLEEAALNCLTDPIEGITSPLLIGTVPEIGTAYNKFYINAPMIAANTTKPDEWLDKIV